MNIHRNARLTPRGRELIVARWQAGETPGAIASATGVSPATVYKWLRRFKAEGLAGLADRSSRPHRLQTRITSEQLKQVQARFTQRAQMPDGSVGEVTGNFKLWRPGRVRIEYDAPSRDFIVADGSAIYQWDDSLKQQSQTSIDNTLAGFILKRNLDFAGEDVTVTGVAHPTPTRMEISLRSVKDPQAGDMTLLLQEVPLQLQGWRVHDAQGVTTEVTLSDIQENASFRRSDFVFRNPNFGANRNSR